MNPNKRRLKQINSICTFATQKPKTFAVWVFLTYFVGKLIGEFIVLAQTGDLHPWLAFLLVFTLLLWLITFPLDYIASHNRKVYQQDYWDRHWAD